MRSTAARSLAIATIATCAALMLGGCGSDSANEKAVEKAIESAAPSVDATVSDGGGGVKATDKAGNEISVGSSATVPAGFPSDIPLPEGTLQAAAKGEKGSFVLTYKVSGSKADVSSAYSTQLSNAGLTIDTKAGAALLGAVQAEGKGYEVTSVVVGGTSANASVLTVTVRPKS